MPLANCTSDLCQNGGTCLPTPDSAQLCLCPVGFHGSMCQFDVNECLAGNGGCEHECVNVAGSFYCRCHAGFELAENARNCIGQSLSSNHQNLCSSQRCRRMRGLQWRLSTQMCEHRGRIHVPLPGAIAIGTEWQGLCGGTELWPKQWGMRADL